MHSGCKNNRLQKHPKLKSRISGAVFSLCLAFVSAQALASDFKTTAANGTIFYDGPSPRAYKLFVSTANYPVESSRRKALGCASAILPAILPGWSARHCRIVDPRWWSSRPWMFGCNPTIARRARFKRCKGSCSTLSIRTAQAGCGCVIVTALPVLSVCARSGASEYAVAGGPREHAKRRKGRNTVADRLTIVQA